MRELSPTRVLSAYLGETNCLGKMSVLDAMTVAEEWRCLSEGAGAGLPAVLQDSEGRCDCTASLYQECPNVQRAAAWHQVPG